MESVDACIIETTMAHDDSTYCNCKKSLKIPKGTRIRKSKKDRQHNGQKKKDKQRSIKYYT